MGKTLQIRAGINNWENIDKLRYKSNCARKIFWDSLYSTVVLKVPFRWIAIAWDINNCNTHALPLMWVTLFSWFWILWKNIRRSNFPMNPHTIGYVMQETKFTYFAHIPYSLHSYSKTNGSAFIRVAWGKLNLFCISFVREMKNKFLTLYLRCFLPNSHCTVHLL